MPVKPEKRKLEKSEKPNWEAGAERIRNRAARRESGDPKASYAPPGLDEKVRDLLVRAKCGHLAEKFQTE